MGLLDALVPEGRGGNWADRAWEMLLRGPSAKSGQYVNTRTALGVSTVLSCCRVLAEGIAQVPFQLLQEDSSGRKRRAKEHPVYKLLWRRPNDWMTSFEFRETMMYHALLCKGGFAIINRVGGKVYELLPLLPDTVTPRQGERFQLSYIVRMPDGSEMEVPRNSMFVVRGPSWDGFKGMEMIDLAREAIGLAIATEENHARFHANGAKTAGLISMAGTLSEPAREQLKKAFQEATTGSSAYRTIVLDNGAKYERMAMTGVDSQHIETRRMQVEEICREFRVFPQMVGFSGNTTTTYASAEQFFSAHVIHSLGPWAERWEQAADRDLLAEDELNTGFYTKLHLRGLQRGDAAARSAYYKSGIVDGWLTRNEARAEEELDPIDGLDEPLVPLNMATASSSGKPPAQPGEAAKNATYRGEEIDLTIPEGVSEQAQLGLEWREKYGRGGTEVGLASARRLAKGGEATPDFVRKVAAYFPRHEVDKEGQGWNPGEEGYPSNGRIAWALWGGEQGKRWASAKVETLNAIDEESGD